MQNKFIDSVSGGTEMTFYTDSGREIHYYGEEFGESIHSKVEGDPVTTLNDLFGVLLKSWVRETAYPSAQKDPQYCLMNQTKR
jgi:hypothetical protein